MSGLRRERGPSPLLGAAGNVGTSDKRPVIADLCLPRDSGVGRRQVAGAGRWGTAGAGTREGRRLHVSGGAQWNQSRTAGAERKAGGMGGERGRGVERRAGGTGRTLARVWSRGRGHSGGGSAGCWPRFGWGGRLERLRRPGVGGNRTSAGAGGVGAGLRTAGKGVAEA